MNPPIMVRIHAPEPKRTEAGLAGRESRVDGRSPQKWASMGVIVFAHQPSDAIKSATMKGAACRGLGPSVRPKSDSKPLNKTTEPFAQHRGRVYGLLRVQLRFSRRPNQPEFQSARCN